MTKLGAWKNVGALAICAATAIAAQGQVFTTLADFDSKNGEYASGSLVQGVDGNFYGTTAFGGANNSNGCENIGCGTVFRISSDGKLTTLYSFCSQINCADGQMPFSGLVQGIDGGFYGAALYGGADGYGTVFKVTAEGRLTTLHSFGGADGADPEGTLVFYNGSFYGTTVFGGAFDSGTVYKISSTGVLTTLYSLNGTSDGSKPVAGLVQATNGNFFGTTYQGGAFQGGTAYSVTPQGMFRTVHTFCSQSACADGEDPTGTLVQGTDGNLYGTTTAAGWGTIFRMSLEGTVTTLHYFTLTDGAGPQAGLTAGIDENFYGTTAIGGDLTCGGGGGCGTIFEITPEGVLTSLHMFDGKDGAGPMGPLLQSTTGAFYGPTYYGGLDKCNDGCGTIYTLDTGLGPFAALVRSPAKIGQVFGILGQGFTGTTNISLNGTPAPFTIKSDTLILATVPAGATSGLVTVVTPSGTLTSNVPFHVLP